MVSPFCLRAHRLATDITAMLPDRGRACVALGCRDGVVSLWDLRALTLCSIPGRHETAVSALQIMGWHVTGVPGA